MLNGKAHALIISILIHVIIIAAIASIEFKLPEEKSAPKQSIKSYIYTPPKVKKVAQKITQTKKEPKPVTEDSAELNTPDNKKAIINAAPETEKAIVKTAEPLTTNEAPAQAALLSESDLTKQSERKRISARQQLSKLRSQLNQQIINQEFTTNQTTRSPSVMHAVPKTVSKSVVPLTPDQKKYQATTSYTDNISIIKNENGTCTIERDLGYVGIEGVKSREGFNCGESKFDKDFREHMKAVQAKIGK